MAGVKVTLTCAGCGKEHTYEIPTTNAQEYKQAVLRLFYLGGMVNGREWYGEFGETEQNPIAFFCNKSECLNVTDHPGFDRSTQLFSRPSEQFVYTGESSMASMALDE